MTSSPFFSCLRASAAFIFDFRFLAVADAFKLGAERTFPRVGTTFFIDWFTFESPSETDGLPHTVRLETDLPDYIQKKASTGEHIVRLRSYAESSTK